MIHIYNPDTKSWDHVRDVPYSYLLGKSVHIGVKQVTLYWTGTHVCGKADDMLTTCLLLTITPK